MRKENNPSGSQEIRFVLGNTLEACLGPWVPRSEPLHQALKPYVQDMGGVLFVPARLVNRVNKAVNGPPPNSRTE